MKKLLGPLADIKLISGCCGTISKLAGDDELTCS